MPDMDGMELLEKIRASNAALPFILVTSQGSKRLAVRALMQGAYNYLRKPFDNGELFYTVERAAETRRLWLVERERALEAAVGVRTRRPQTANAAAGHPTRRAGGSVSDRRSTA